MRLCSIASGSSGNCIYVGSDQTHLLVDTGIDLAKAVSNILCAGTYAGIIFGLVGGILYLQRRTGEDDL